MSGFAFRLLGWDAVAIIPRMYSAEEMRALRLYSGRDHKKINECLRGFEEHDKEIRAAIGFIDDALSRSFLPNKLIGYRGLDGDAAAYIRRMKLNIGDAFQEPGYASISAAIEPARLFAAWPPGGLILKIHIRSGMRGIDMAPFSDYPDEREFLLPRETQFRVRTLENPASGLMEVEVAHG